MKRRLVKAGDVFALPLEDGKSALCRVLFRSDYFKSVMLVSIHGLFEAETEVERQLARPSVAKFYCSSESLAKGSWQWLASSVVTAADAEQTRRIVAGEVWVEDNHLGKAAAADASLPQMDVYGNRILARRVSSLL